VIGGRFRVPATCLSGIRAAELDAAPLCRGQA
jgi:hypothetical protein